MVLIIRDPQKGNPNFVKPPYRDWGLQGLGGFGFGEGLGVGSFGASSELYWDGV